MCDYACRTREAGGVRLKQLRVQRFKAFERFDLNLGDNAFLVGPNNAGKSTLIAAIRSAARMLTYARRRSASSWVHHGEIAVLGHAMSSLNIDLVAENLRHQFRDNETTLRLTLDTGLVLTAVWPAEGDGPSADPCFYLTDKAGLPLTQTRQVRALSEQVGIIPSLYPINHEEHVLDEDYVTQHFESARSSQHTRNHLYSIRRSGEWKEFQEFALEWLTEIDQLRVVERPGASIAQKDLDVFIREKGDRIPKELFWAGDGFQAFVQLLAHAWRLRDAAVVVLDEPDLYLHADLQRRLVRLLESLPAQTVTATHSPEMLAEASADSVVWVDKSRRRGVKRPDPSTFADLSSQIGSQFNLRLAAALRAKAVVFVEGNDMTLLRRLATSAGCDAVAAELGCTVIGMEGFSHWIHVEPFQWLLRDFLEGSVSVHVVLDRDYRGDSKIVEIEHQLRSSGVHGHVWRRKELESYLLEVPALARLAAIEVTEAQAMIDIITESMVGRVKARLLADQIEATVSSPLSNVTIIENANIEIDLLVSDPTWRLHRFPAKDILSGFNAQLQTQGRKAVSAQRLARGLKESEIASEVAAFLRRVEEELA